MADYYLKTDNIMKNMFTVALKDELAAQSQMGKVRPATEAMLQKVRSYELSEKRLPITIEEQRELRNALNRLRDKYLAMGRYSDGIDSVILKVMKPNTSRRFFWEQKGGMSMKIYDQKQVEQLRKRYPKGTRLCLDFMDEAGMPPGLQGTVAFIDDAGQIHMHWENGRSLAIVPGVDSFHRVDGPAKEAPKSEKAKKERSQQR